MKNIYYILSLLILIASCTSKTETITENENPVIKVKVAKVEKNSLNNFFTASGKIQAVQSADLSTRIMGFVEKVNVNVGDKVTKGQQLISINNTDLKAKIGQVKSSILEAEASFKNAEKNYLRFKKLHAQNSASDKEMDDITTNYNMAKARLESVNELKNEVQSQFDYANIKAPFTGIITNKYIKEGDMANPGMSLLTIENGNDLEVIATVSENEIIDVKKNTNVYVSISSVNKRIEGNITEISSSSKNTGNQFLVKIELKNTPKEILSGMFATVEFYLPKVEKQNSKILIPTASIIKKGELTGVYTVSQTNKALLRWLRLGKVYGDKVEVLSGLNTTESYIISSEGKLFNGANISIQ